MSVDVAASETSCPFSVGEKIGDRARLFVDGANCRGRRSVGSYGFIACPVQPSQVFVTWEVRVISYSLIQWVVEHRLVLVLVVVLFVFGSVLWRWWWVIRVVNHKLFQGLAEDVILAGIGSSRCRWWWLHQIPCGR